MKGEKSVEGGSEQLGFNLMKTKRLMVCISKLIWQSLTDPGSTSLLLPSNFKISKEISITYIPFDPIKLSQNFWARRLRNYVERMRK